MYTQLNGFKHRYVQLTIRRTIKEFQVLLINTNNSIQYKTFFSTVKLFQVLLYITNNSIKYQSFVNTTKGSYSFIWPINKTLWGATTSSQNGPGSNGIDEVLNTPQNSRVGASPSDDFRTLVGRGGSYPSAMMQSVYFSTPADWG